VPRARRLRDRRREGDDCRPAARALGDPHVGPVWRGGEAGEAELLAECHRRALEVAQELGARSVAFPAISCGVYGYPVEQAARIAVETVAGHQLDVVRFVLFNDRVYDAFARALG
jgi:Predicted phosphatase homologous to the C-terminal domain of histone macroH2A1